MAGLKLVFALLAFAASVFASSVELVTPLGVRATSYCGQYDSVTSGNYILYLDQWGLDDATSGSDCASITSSSGSEIAWSATWTWTGGTGVKAYTNVALNSGLNQKLSAISSIPTSWSWSQSITSSSVADVAYDLFTSSSSGGSNEYEIMIWLSNTNSGPISYTYSSSGDAEPIASSISIGGYTWDLYYGSNGSNYVYSFLVQSGTITSFSSDIMDFFDYLVDYEDFSTSQYLTTVEAGTEETSGSATLTTSSYSVSIST
ncbi:glycoside hydrolase family 12 protein [Fistulina hepatica ATCC 64428]|uniref:Glycoside hydrolase family 12 protein n=1 Tax=Fistulina hepatica ATCC 64428 TaxID=1128425 RepID=A0A0D6ZZR0_9AGAR|nr:glycoside hydrolase family 12 protein [Fistulina hepatica ATCC 64428]